jgi:hypothetical protein
LEVAVQVAWLTSAIVSPASSSRRALRMRWATCRAWVGARCALAEAGEAELPDAGDGGEFIEADVPLRSVCEIVVGQAKRQMVVGMVTEGRGFSNTKRALGWELRYPSWRQGFKDELA